MSQQKSIIYLSSEVAEIVRAAANSYLATQNKGYRLHELINHGGHSWIFSVVLDPQVDTVMVAKVDLDKPGHRGRSLPVYKGNYIIPVSTLAKETEALRRIQFSNHSRPLKHIIGPGSKRGTYEMESFQFEKHYKIHILFLERLCGSLATLHLGQQPRDQVIKKLREDLGRALKRVHEKGYRYMDFQPGNILIRKENGRLSFVLSDFGLASYGGHHVGVIGTAPYQTASMLSQSETVTEANDWESLGFVIDEWENSHQ
jgi:serine/threonine protein kinase